MTQTKTPPKGLGARGRAFWRATVRDFDLSDVECEVLREACRLLDEVDSLREAIDADGVTVTGSQGQTRVNPAIGEVRQHRLALARLLAQLDLPDVDGGRVLTPTQARASRAAQTRWGTRGSP